MTAGPPSIRPRRLVAACALALTAACGDDPTATRPSCGETPLAPINGEVVGTLGEGDPRFQGARIDYYHIDVVLPQRLTITLSSARFDPLLYFFGEDGDVLRFSFEETGAPEGGEETTTINAPSVQPACYLIGASSWELDGTGIYTLTVQMDTAAASGATAGRHVPVP